MFRDRVVPNTGGSVLVGFSIAADPSAAEPVVNQVLADPPVENPPGTDDGAIVERIGPYCRV